VFFIPLGTYYEDPDAIVPDAKEDAAKTKADVEAEDSAEIVMEDTEEDEEETDAPEKKEEEKVSVPLTKILTDNDIKIKYDIIYNKEKWQVLKCPVTKEKGKVSKHWTATKMLEWIGKSFDRIREVEPVVTHTILYYSGAAKEDGNWLCQDGSSVSIADVFKLAEDKL
jgi:hypothetical protein